MKKRLCVLFGLFWFFVIMINACKMPLDQGYISEKQKISTFETSEIRRDYDRMMATAGARTTGKGRQERTNKRKMRWDESYALNTSDGEKMVVPFSLEEELFFYDHSGERISYSATTFFIVSKKEGKYNYEVATYIPDDTDDPSKITKDWSGQILLEDAHGNFKKSYILADGKIINEGTDQPANGRTYGMDCREVEYWSCAYIPSEGYYAPCEYMYTITICYGTVPPATGTASNGYLQIISGISPTGGGGGGGTGGSSIYGNMIDRVTNLMRFSNFTNAQKVWLNDILDNLMTQSCLFRSIYANIIAYNGKVDWYIDPNSSTPGTYNSVNKRISFQNQGQINEQTVREELFHRYQDLWYMGGITQYVTNGRSNIEFEAKFLRDLTGVMKGGGGVTSQTVGDANSTSYLIWLDTITSGGTKFPDSWSDISSDYFNYLEMFKQANPLYNYPTINSLYPNALINLINSSSCPK